MRSRRRTSGLSDGRLARGSVPPHSPAREWLIDAVRSRFPKLAAAMGPPVFDAMLAAYLVAEPPARRSVRESGARLAGFLASTVDYPRWYAELARLDRAHVEVLHAPVVPAMTRRDLTVDGELRLVPAHALVDMTTEVDTLWHALDRGAHPKRPRDLDWPRSVLLWRTKSREVADRIVEPDEAAALRAATRGTSIVELTAGFVGDNPRARALDVVLAWIDAGVVAR
jgi:hypothetical protein